jgi:transposase-like protein
VREGGRTVSVAALVAVDAEGRREIVGPGLGPSEAEASRSAFLEGLVRRGPGGVKLVAPDAREELKHATAKVLGAAWQRCRVQSRRNSTSRSMAAPFGMRAEVGTPRVTLSASPFAAKPFTVRPPCATA